MSQSCSASLEIQSTPEELFEIITDLDAYPEWVDNLKAIEVLEETAEGYPHRARMTVDAKIKTVEYTLVYDYDYPVEVSWTSEAGGDLRQVDGAYRLVGEAGESPTTVHYDLEIDPGFPVPGFLLKQAEKTIIKSGLDGLKDRAES